MGKHKRLALLAGATLLAPLLALTAATTTANAVGGSFTNNNSITFSCGTSGTCTATTSAITQFGMSTVVSDVNVTLNNVSHTFPDDLDVELIYSYSGTNIVVPLMSDACNTTDMTGINLTFDDGAAAALPDGDNASCNTSHSVKPSNYSDGDPEQWSSAPTAATLAAFNGINPNGTWQLSAGDDHNQDTGSIAGGWTLTIATSTNAPITMPALGVNGAGPASQYPAPIAVTGKSGLIKDVNLTIPGFAHTFPSDLAIILQSPSGTTARIMAGSCGGTDVLNQNFTFDDAAATVIGAASCTSGGTFKVTGSTPSSLPAPAPAAPYGASLAVFNGQNPNGQWKLWINDAAGADGGWISATPTLTFDLTDVIPPDTLLVGKKPENTTKTKVKVKFKSTEANSTFQCKLDGASYKSCTSPFKANNLKIGKHKLFIKAIDSSGNQDKKPLKIKWKIFKAKTLV